MRRDFYALSGLFYVADSHFEMFFKGRERSRTEIATELKTGTLGLSQEINLDSLTAYLALRFPDRDHGDSGSISELVRELHDSEYKSLEQLNDAIDSGYDAFVAYEKALPPTSGSRFIDVGVVRILLGIVDRAFRTKKYSTTAEFLNYESLIKPKS
jgi:hypothetical protein